MFGLHQKASIEMLTARDRSINFIKNAQELMQVKLIF